MGHKTHPLGFRLGITQAHRSSWYSKLNTYSALIQEDYKMRAIIFEYLNKNFLHATGITKILIHRNQSEEQIHIEVHTARPGILVGKAGIGIESIDKQLIRELPTRKTLIGITEITNAYEHADLVADTIVSQLKERVPFRRVMKDIIQRLQKENLQGIKVQIAGRVNGAEIARTEWLREGRVPLQTLKANIDYSYKTAKTNYGILGVKVWLFKKDQKES